MKHLIMFILILLVVPVCYASTDSYIGEISFYVDDYNKGNIDAAKLIVYIEYMKNKLYEDLDKGNEEAFTEAEIKNMFDWKDLEKRKENRMWNEPQFEKIFQTKDFDVVLLAYPFYRYDRDYYEKKEEESQSYFKLDYEIRPTKGSINIEEIENEINDFIGQLRLVIEQENNEKMDELSKTLGKIKPRIHQLDNCEKLMGSVFTEEKDENRKERVFSLRLKEQNETRCHSETQCGNVCEPEEFCSDKCDVRQVCNEECVPECYNEENCEENCVNVTDEYNNTSSNCSTECLTEEVCSENCNQSCHSEPFCENVCEMKDRCFDKCEPVEMCEDVVNGELRVEGVCGEDFSDIFINAYGPGLDHYNQLNDFHEEQDCEARIQSLVNVRKAIQDSVNNDFAKWFFEEFLIDDPEKIINGDSGFKRVLEVLTRNEEEISNELFCSMEPGWPAGFENINIEYRNNNANIEVWEKRIPVEGMQIKYWTTLYKYSFIPNKELVKKLIHYKISEQDTFGPTAKDVAEIKSDEGKMEIVKRLSNKYGGSFDLKLELEDESGTIVKKYLQINEDVAVKMADQIDGKEDISINIDFNVLYDFISYMSFTMEGNEIKGPCWVNVNDKGPGKIFSAIGAISKMWREGITIKPRHALFKLFFNTGNLISLMSDSGGSDNYDQGYEKEEVRIAGNAILEKGG